MSTNQASTNSLSQEDSVVIFVEPKYRKFVAFSMFITMFVNYFATGALSTVMPAIIESIGGIQYYGLVFTIATVAMAIASPISSKIGERFGQKRVFFLGTLVMVLTTAAMGLAPTMELMLVLRLVNGASAAFTIVGGLTIVGCIFPQRERVKYIGYFGAITAVGNVLAPMLGGVFSDSIGWQWIFIATLPIGLIALFVFMRYMPQVSGSLTGGGFDKVGTLVFALLMVLITLVCQLGGTSFSWASLPAVLFLVAIVIVLVVYLKVERRQGSTALMPMQLMNKPIFVICLLSVILSIAATISIYVYLPLYLQSVVGCSATAAGLSVTIYSIVMTVGSAFLGQFLAKTGKVKMVIFVGLVILGGANLFYGFFAGAATPLALVYLIQVVYGVGATIINTIYTMTVQLILPPEEIGVATANIQMGQTIGSSIGMAVFSAMMNVSKDLSVSLPLVFLTASALAAVCIVLTLFIRTAHAPAGAKSAG